MPRRLLVLLAALTALALTSLAGIASAASTGVGGQTRVGAFQTAGPSLSGAIRSESSCTHPGSAAGSAWIAVGFCVAAEDGGGFLSNLWSRLGDETGSFTPPIKTPWGWSGSASYRAAVSEIGGGGTLEAVGGTIPSQAQAEQLIEDAGGTVQRIEEGHLPPNPHTYPHINYTTAGGLRGTVQIAP